MRHLVAASCRFPPVACGLLVLLALAVGSPSPAPHQPPRGIVQVASSEEPEQSLGERVNVAIDRGIEWLRGAQHEDGSWGPCISGGRYGSNVREERPCYISGPTTFAMFTLARCGISRKDAGMKKGLKWARERLITGMETGKLEGRSFASYEASSGILMLTALYDEGKVVKPARLWTGKPAGSAFSKRDWTLLGDLVVHLVGQVEDGKKERPGCQARNGGWGYWLEGASADVSATQFALLALREATRAGFPVEQVAPKVWEQARSYVMDQQLRDGGFRYDAEEPASGMVAAGTASLLILREQLEEAGSAAAKEELDRAITRGLDACGTYFLPDRNLVPSKKDTDSYHYCHLYAIERAGSLARKHLMGQRNWYAEGAQYLVNQQYEDGHWSDGTCMRPKDVLGTCFALLFLKRATRPAVITGG